MLKEISVQIHSESDAHGMQFLSRISSYRIIDLYEIIKPHRRICSNGKIVPSEKIKELSFIFHRFSKRQLNLYKTLLTQ